MTVQGTPGFDAAAASRLALEIFGIVAAASALPSERDQNFALLTARGESFVLTVSCAIGLAVLKTVMEESLQAHALRVGDYLLAELRSLMNRHCVIGDVRGSGLFLGVELVPDRRTLAPAGEEASLIVNRLRQHGVLIGTEGPHHNVLKIRPPMPFNEQDARTLTGSLDDALCRLDT